MLTLEPDYSYAPFLPPAPVWKTTPRVFIPAGAHTFRWETGNAHANATARWVQVDALVITPLYAAPGELPLADALDAPGLTFVGDNHAPSRPAWSGRQLAGAAGGDAAVLIGNRYASELKTSITGARMLSFRWKAEYVPSAGYQPSPPELRLM